METAASFISRRVQNGDEDDGAAASYLNRRTQNRNRRTTGILVGGMALTSSIAMYETSSVSEVVKPKVDDSLHGLDPTKYHGTYPHSLLTLFYPYTLFRDVVLDQPVDGSDIIYFWHLHNSDERAYKKILTECYGKELVELNDKQSITEAKDMNLVSKLDPKKHVVTSPFIRETAEIFTTDNFGRMICFFRHPLDYDLHPDLPVFPAKDNWLARLLSNHHEDELTFKELGVAKHVVRQACLVGEIDKMKQSIVRFGKHLNWPYAHNMTEGEGLKCIDDNLLDFPKEKFADHTTDAWLSFYEQNLFDSQLYELSQSAWRHQIQTIIPWELQLSRNQDDDEGEE